MITTIHIDDGVKPEIEFVKVEGDEFIVVRFGELTIHPPGLLVDQISWLRRFVRELKQIGVNG